MSLFSKSLSQLTDKLKSMVDLEDPGQSSRVAANPTGNPIVDKLLELQELFAEMQEAEMIINGFMRSAGNKIKELEQLIQSLPTTEANAAAASQKTEPGDSV